MFVEKLSERSRQIIFTARKIAEKETLGLPTFAHLLSSFSSQSDDNAARVWQSFDLKIDSASLYQTAPLDEILNESLREARNSSSETVETSHLLISTLKFLKIPEPILLELRRRLSSADGLPSSSSKKKSALESFTLDLSSPGSRLLIRPEVEEVFKVLLRKEKACLCLTGEKGVGKTSLVKSLAQFTTFIESDTKHNQNKPAMASKFKRDVSNHSATDRQRKPLKIRQFNSTAFAFSELPNPDEAFTSLLTEAAKEKDLIIFFDDFNNFFLPSLAFHNVVPTLKAYLESYPLKIIVAYNNSDFSRAFEQEEFFSKFFTTIDIEETKPVETLEILKLKVSEFSAFHGLKINQNFLSSVASFADYINEGSFPEKAVDLLDLACVEAKIQQRSTLTLPDIRVAAAHLTGIPLVAVDTEEKTELSSLERALSAQIIGQSEAIGLLSRTLRKARLGLQERTRPLGCFLFLGPTGVGKTELARALAQQVFGKSGSFLNLIKVDMSEFRERHTVSRLIGAPPGYVGFGQGGELTEKVSRHPYSLVLVDEMEKAAPEVLNIFLQVMDEGVLTDGEGNVVDFRHTIVIFTSNVGADLIKKGKVGFSASFNPQPMMASNRKEESHQVLEEKLLAELKTSFKPEFLNRLDKIVVFRKLNGLDVQKITQLQLEKVSQRFSGKNIAVKFGKAVNTILAKEGFSEEYGARFLKRTVEEKIVDPLAEYLISGRLGEGDKVQVLASGKKLNFKIKKRSKK